MTVLVNGVGFAELRKCAAVNPMLNHDQLIPIIADHYNIITSVCVCVCVCVIAVLWSSQWRICYHILTVDGL